MSVQTIVLFGDVARLYDKETYSTNQDPESLSLSLSDSSSLTDNGVRESAIKALAEAITGADSRIVAVGTKPLSDSATLTETLAKALTHAFTPESITLGDSQTNHPTKALPGVPVSTGPIPLFGALNYTESQYGCSADGLYDGKIFLLEAVINFLAIKALTDGLTITEQRIFVATVALSDGVLIEDASIRLVQTKGFSDFVLVKDWLNLRLQRADVWQATAAFNFRPSQIHLYGPNVYYGFDFYASNPSVNWLLTSPNTTTWQMQEQATQGETLYAATQYGQASFGSIPAVGWTAPQSTARQAWTNQNGESHN